jgi:hypothetical protein
MLLVTGSQSKNVSCFAWIWPNSDRRLVNHCAMPSIGQTWVLASIDAVVEMGILSTLKRLFMESNCISAYQMYEVGHQIDSNQKEKSESSRNGFSLFCISQLGEKAHKPFWMTVTFMKANQTDTSTVVFTC